MIEKIKLLINDKKREFEVDLEEPLLYILREDANLYGPKYGCGMGQCGACMVLVDGRAQPSCLLTCGNLHEAKIKTIEGLAKNGNPHPLQEAFFEVQAAQCGYCLNGMLISAVSLLEENPSPSISEIKEALNRVLCRCGTHSRFIKAVQLASEKSQNA
ncbi:hypothetical protein P872_17365 [Rhodonellum psychrophilum GCM71 = DSM 17998]|uniref:2Fe-2S ferredoxin-type domain-containing protein n=2 Tax=Rhodonellum TaxID=336827 RepID=U5C4I5_9BACT|nr:MULTISPECIES: (2Fe-2S)-binding protein [Rhodonellum]ERM83117.1 hypothetical protein P872_17365 [Rhodonellum psychrophilum GCM71 = DSM 17998]MDO9554043.1 (2Fe-2S)-binding protein [Rhodonellum sp.]SDY98182.1 nicotinate dehydrogenase subunit A [Rhodonellum ikkaensis]